MDGGCLKSLLLDFADCAKVLDRAEADQCAQLCEIAKASLLARAKSFVLSAQGSAVLMSYQSDSTPLLARATLLHDILVGRLSPGEQGDLWSCCWKGCS